jgi:RNA polymerase sigma-70 factor (ECF subfamily)
MGADDYTDRAVWDAVLAGESRAFGVLYDRHRDRVFRHALRQFSEPVDAEDLTAIAFLELWRRRASARFVDESLLPWLLVTTSNAARNAQRSRRRHARVLARLPPPDHEPDLSEQADRRLDSEATHAALSAAIADLPHVDRELITLTSLEGFSLQQASNALGISHGAAKTRMSRVRRKLGDSISKPTVRAEGTTP